METRANYALIGLFTLAVVAAAFGFVYWFSGGDRGQARQQVRIVFSGSVSGLSRGSMVLFNGLRVGEVTQISLLPEDPRRVVSIVELDRSTPIRTDTKARLEYQGLTGVAQIALVGGEPGAPVLVAGPGQPMPTIFAENSAFQDLIETARSVAGKADEVLTKVGNLVTDNEVSINRTIRNAETFSKALSDNAPGIDRLLQQVGAAAERVGPLAEKLETLATRVDEVVQAVDKNRVASIVENVDNFTQALGHNREAIDQAVKDAGALIKSLNASAPKLDAALTDAGTLMKSLNASAPKLDAALDSVGSLAKSFDTAKIGRTVDNVDRFAQTLSDRSQDIDQTIVAARQLAQNLNATAPKLDTAIADAGALVKSLNASTPKLDAALDSVGNLAKAFDPAKIGRTVDNVDRFAQTLSNRSQDVDQTIIEARQLSEKLNKSADRVDGVLKAAQDFLGSAAGEEGKSAFEEIREAARSIRVLADNLDKRTAEITTGITRFTGSGLRDYQTLAVEGRKTVNDIGRAVRSLERNPQQLIFGGQPSIPQYNGRR